MNERKPWIIGVIAGAAVLAVAGIAALIIFYPSTSEPTSLTLAPGFLDLADVKVSPDYFLTVAPTAPGNAGDDYKKAADLYEQNRDAIEEFNKKVIDW